MRRLPLALATALTCVLGVACDGDTPTTPTTVSSPTTISWTTLLGPGGTASRSFTTTQSGTVTITLLNAPFPLGIGVGVQQSSGSGCLLSVSTTAAAGSSPPLSIAVGDGEYCVKVYDEPRLLTDPISFTLEIIYP